MESLWASFWSWNHCVGGNQCGVTWRHLHTHTHTHTQGMYTHTHTSHVHTHTHKACTHTHTHTHTPFPKDGYWYTHTHTHTHTPYPKDGYWFSGKVQPKSMFSNCHQWTYSQVSMTTFFALKNKRQKFKNPRCDHSPRARHPEVQSQMGLRKHHYKVNGGDGIPDGLFQILKVDGVKVLHSIWQQIWKIQQWPQDCKRSVFIPVPKKGNAKECSNYHTLALISHASKVMLKILQARLQQYVNFELPDVQSGFRKDRRTRDQIANIHWIIKKESSRKTFISALLTMPRPLTVKSQQTVENSSRDGNTRPRHLHPEKSVYSSKNNN